MTTPLTAIVAAAALAGQAAVTGTSDPAALKQVLRQGTGRRLSRARVDARARRRPAPRPGEGGLLPEEGLRPRPRAGLPRPRGGGAGRRGLQEEGPGARGRRSTARPATAASPPGCAELGGMLEAGDRGREEPRPRGGAARPRRARAASRASCGRLAAMYETGSPMPRDDRKAVALLTPRLRRQRRRELRPARRGHRRGPGHRPRHRRAPPLSPARAATPAFVPACVGARRTRSSRGDRVAARPAAGARALHEGLRRRRAARLLRPRPRCCATATAPARDAARAAELFKRACDGHVGAACHDLAFVVGRPRPGRARRPRRRPTSLLRQACTDGDPRGCVELGKLFQAGTAVQQDVNRAAALFEEACGKGALAGCSALAPMLEVGDLIGRNLPRARGAVRAHLRRPASAPTATRSAASSSATRRPPTARPPFEAFSKGCAAGSAPGLPRGRRRVGGRPRPEEGARASTRRRAPAGRPPRASASRSCSSRREPGDGRAQREPPSRERVDLLLDVGELALERRRCAPPGSAPAGPPTTGSRRRGCRRARAGAPRR